MWSVTGVEMGNKSDGDGDGHLGTKWTGTKLAEWGGDRDDFHPRACLKNWLPRQRPLRDQKNNYRSFKVLPTVANLVKTGPVC